MPGDSAHLRKAETKQVPDAGGHSVLIETGRQAYRVAEATTKQGLLEAQVAHLQLSPQPCQAAAHQRPVAPQRRLTQGLQGELAELLGVGPLVSAQQRADEALIQSPGAGLSHPDSARPLPILTLPGPNASVHPPGAAPANRANARVRCGLPGS